MNALRLRHRREEAHQTYSSVAVGRRTGAIVEFALALQDVELFFAEEIEFVRDLGRGTSFDVRCCKNVVSGELVAVKSPRPSQRTRAESSKALSQAVLAELKLATYPPLATSPHLAQLLGVLNSRLDALEHGVVDISLIYEYSALGTLGDLLSDDNAVRYSHTQACSLAVDVTAGLAALHAHQVVHGDVKPDNILLFRVNPSTTTTTDAEIRLTAKLSDFGNAIAENSGTGTNWSFLVQDVAYGGTPMFNPQFVADVGGQIPFHLAPLCDLYALGLTIWSIYRHGYFFTSVTNDEQQLHMSGESGVSWQSIPWLSSIYANDPSLGDLAPIARETLNKVMDICVFRSDFSLPNPIAPRGRLRIFGDTFTRVSAVATALTGSQHATTLPEPYSTEHTRVEGAEVPSWNLQVELHTSVKDSIFDASATHRSKGLACLRLSSFFATGLGCKRDMNEAARYFTMAAEFNNMVAEIFIHRVFAALNLPSPGLTPRLLPEDVNVTSSSSGEDPQDDASDSDTLMDDDDDDGNGSNPSESSDSNDEDGNKTRYALFLLSGVLHAKLATIGEGAAPEDWYCSFVRLIQRYVNTEPLSRAPLLSKDGETLYSSITSRDLMADSVTLLHHGHTPIVRYRMSDKTWVDEWTLHLAATCGAVDLIKSLLRHGADVNGLDFEGRTPLYCATKHGQAAATRLLVTRKADASIQLASGQFALQNLWIFEDDEISEMAVLLVKRAGADINAVCLQGVVDSLTQLSMLGSALHVCVGMRNQAAVRALLALGANPNLRPSDASYTPLERAANYHFPEMVDLLLKHGAKLHTPTADGWPGWALHAAVQASTPLLRWLHHGPNSSEPAMQTVKLLVSEAVNVGVDISTKNERGLTVIEEALTEGGEDSPILEALMTAGGYDLPPTALIHAADSCSGANCENLDFVLSRQAHDLMSGENNNTVTETIAVCALKGAVAALASLYQRPPIARLFTIGDDNGMTASHFAADGGQRDVLVWLRQHGALSHAEDVGGCSPLGWAIRSGSRTCMEFFLCMSETALIVRRGRLAGVSVLYHGLRGETHDDASRLAYLLSGDLGRGHDRFPLLHHDNVLNAAADATGDTLLHAAAEHGDYEAVFSLIRAGAASIRNRQGKFPLDVARERLNKLAAEDLEKSNVLQTRTMDAIIAQLG